MLGVRMRVKKTYALAVDFEQEEDGSWSVDIPAIPACAAWGSTKEEALENLQDLTQGYLEVLLEHGDPLPKSLESNETGEIPVSVPGFETVTIVI